jgi:predicted YcjX-like family ATPase
VLVDVLKILRHGVVAYNDTRECISEILHAYHSPWRPFKGIKRVIFAATKADHATKSYRPNMTRLLDELISKAKGPIVNGVAIEKSEWFTSVRATSDGRSEWDGRPCEVLIGTMKGNTGQVIKYYPGVVPAEWPGNDEWVLDNRAYNFPEFEPLQLAKRDGAALPHLNLDRIIWKVLKGCF